MLLNVLVYQWIGAFCQESVRVRPRELYDLINKTFSLHVRLTVSNVVVNQCVSKKPLSMCYPKKLFSEFSCPCCGRLPRVEVLKVFVLELDRV